MITGRTNKRDVTKNSVRWFFSFLKKRDVICILIFFFTSNYNNVGFLIKIKNNPRNCSNKIVYLIEMKQKRDETNFLLDIAMLKITMHKN